MCWFIGLYSARDTKVINNLFEKGMLSIKHRGNNQSVVKDSNYRVWYSRLQTDVLWAGIESKLFLKKIVFNWIIYNTEYLKAKFCLEAKTDFDTLVLSEWYKRHGVKFLENLRWNVCICL